MVTKNHTLFYRGYNELIFQDLLEWQTKCESFNENISLQIGTSCNMCGLLVPANTTRVMDSSSIPCHKVLRRHCKLGIAISPSPDQVANHTLYPWFSVFCNPLEMPQPHTKLLHEYGDLIPDIPGCVPLRLSKYFSKSSQFCLAETSKKKIYINTSNAFAPTMLTSDMSTFFHASFDVTIWFCDMHQLRPSDEYMCQ